MLDDWRAASVRAEVKAALGFLEALVQRGEVTADDVRAAYAAGVTREMLVRAVEVCVGFTMIVRIADTFDFAIPSEDDFDASAKMLLKRGYVL